MSLCEQFRVDLTQAMKSSDKVRLATLRLLTAAIKNRQIAKGGVLDDAEAAYTASLKVDPGNKIALGELDYIAGLRSGKKPTGTVLTMPGAPKS